MSLQSQLKGATSSTIVSFLGGGIGARFLTTVIYIGGRQNNPNLSIVIWGFF